MADEPNPGASLLGGDGAGEPASTPSTPSYLVGADGAFAPNWLDSLPDDLKGNSALTTVPTLADLAKSYVATKSMVGKKFQAPTEASTPEEVAAWRKNVGAPEAPDGYGDLRPEEIPAEMWDANTEGQLKAIAHKHHLPPSAVKDIIALHAATVKGGMEKFQADEAAYKEAGLTTLKKEWGANFDQEAHAAQTFAKAIGLDPNETLDFASPSFVLAMARGAKLIMGDKIVAGAPPALSGGLDSRIRDIQGSPEYRGERGQDAQMSAQSQLHNLLNAKTKAA